MSGPHGVVTAIAASDAPFLRAVLAAAPALAAGNAVVLEPSPATPSSAMELARAVAESDVPPGIFNALPGALPEVGDELASSALVDRVVFQGGASDGIRVAEAAARSSKPAALDLRARCDGLVLADADLDLAVPGALWGAYVLSGQTSRPATRLFVHASIVEPVIHHLVRGATGLRMGDPFSFSTDLGPLLTDRIAAATESLVTRAVEDGAKVACGGARMTGLSSDRFFAPTVLAGVTAGMRAAHDAPAGPVIAVIAVRDDDEAVMLSNGGRTAPAAAVWTRDVQRGLSVARRLRAPAVWVNEYHPLAAGIAAAPAPSGVALDDTAAEDAVTRKAIWLDQRRSVRGREWATLLGLDRIFGIGEQ